jgi:hypothetical protein
MVSTSPAVVGVAPLNQSATARGSSVCFNAAASFAASAVLIPAGIHTLRVAREAEPRWLPLAGFPLLFGIQQAMEGVLWLALGDPLGRIVGVPPGTATPVMALGFLGFAYLLWPVLVPLSARSVEPGPRRRLLFGLLAVLGAAGGCFIYLPLLFNSNWLEVSIHGGSILYEPKILFASALGTPLGRGLYALVVLVPLLTSSEQLVRRFGLMIFLSVVLSAVAYGFAFVSVWCFFAALLSAWLGVRLPERLGEQVLVAGDASGQRHTSQG